MLTRRQPVGKVVKRFIYSDYMYTVGNSALLTGGCIGTSASSVVGTVTLACVSLGWNIFGEFKSLKGLNERFVNIHERRSKIEREEREKSLIANTEDCGENNSLVIWEKEAPKSSYTSTIKGVGGTFILLSLTAILFYTLIALGVFSNQNVSAASTNASSTAIMSENLSNSGTIANVWSMLLIGIGGMSFPIGRCILSWKLTKKAELAERELKEKEGFIQVKRRDVEEVLEVTSDNANELTVLKNRIIDTGEEAVLERYIASDKKVILRLNVMLQSEETEDIKPNNTPELSLLSASQPCDVSLSEGKTTNQPLQTASSDDVSNQSSNKKQGCVLM